MIDGGLFLHYFLLFLRPIACSSVRVDKVHPPWSIPWALPVGMSGFPTLGAPYVSSYGRDCPSRYRVGREVDLDCFHGVTEAF